MNAKEYLQQLRDLDLQINAKIEQKEHYMSLACRTTNHLTDEIFEKNRHYSKVEENVCKMVDIEREMDKEIDQLVDLRREVLATLNQIKDVRFKQILEYRYINYWSWEKMAEVLNYDLSWLHRLHKKALKEFDGVREENEGVMVG